MAAYYLIEYREDGRTVGYLADLRRGDGGLDVFMARDSAKALRFDSRDSAQNVIDDGAFQRTVPRADQFFVEEHMDCAGPALASKPSTISQDQGVEEKGK
jgi:hypothetical protein